jgi:signal peptidase II
MWKGAEKRVSTPEILSEADTTVGWRGATPWYLLAGCIVLFDQVTKALADRLLDYARPVEVLPVFDLTLLYNRGAAFSFLSDAGGWQRWFFTVIAVVVSGLITVWLARLERPNRWLQAGLALVLGGAVGNLVDRIAHGHVIDFISVHWQQNYFPAFNLADSAITVGAVLLIVDMIREWRAERR